MLVPRYDVINNNDILILNFEVRIRGIKFVE